MAPLLRGLVLALATSASAQLSTVSWSKNRGDIFGSFQGRLFHKFWTGSDWQPASVEFLAGDESAYVGKDTSASSWGENRLDVFYPSDSGGHAFHRWWDGDSWEPADGASALGDDLGGPVLGKIASSTTGEGHMELVALSPEQEYVHRWLDGGVWHPDDWESLGGSFFMPPATVRLGGQLHIFGVSRESSTLVHKYWNGDEWIGWEDLGGERLSGPVSASSWGPDRFDVWALGPDGQLLHRYFQTDAYSDWEDLGGDGLSEAPAVASQRPGTLDLLAAKSGPDGLVYLSKSYDGSRWWPALDAWGEHPNTTFSSAPAVLSWSNTTVALFGVTSPEDKLVFRFWWGQGWYPEDGTWAQLADLKDAAAKQAGLKAGLHAQELR